MKKEGAEAKEMEDKIEILEKKIIDLNKEDAVSS